MAEKVNDLTSFWYTMIIADFVNRTIPTKANYDSVANLLGSSSRSDDEIVSDLLDLIGFDYIDLLPTLISRRAEIKQAVESHNASVSFDSLNSARH